MRFGITGTVLSTTGVQIPVDLVTVPLRLQGSLAWHQIGLALVARVLVLVGCLHLVGVVLRQAFRAIKDIRGIDCGVSGRLG